MQSVWRGCARWRESRALAPVPNTEMPVSESANKRADNQDL